MSTGSGRGGVTLPRLAIVFLVILTIYLLRDSWLPREHGVQPSKPDLQSPAPAPSPSPAPPNTALEEQIQHTPAPSKTESGAHTQQTKVEEQIDPDDGVQHPENTSPRTCAEVAGADNVMVMLKTGATELYQKLPAHFVTTFKCIPHFMIFSDLEQSFADYPVHDAIAPINKTLREQNSDFELYRKLQQYKREGQDMSSLKGTGSWNLDKWKFLPMMHQAFTTAADNIEWFVIMEADTSLSWTNLLQWLKTMDPKEPFYLGAQNVIGTTTFAHGGSGIVFSRKTADMLEAVRQERGEEAFDRKWEDLTSQACCGDEVIARTLLQEADIPLTPAWPIIQGETPSSLDWTVNHWCAPPVTWHHVSAIEIDSLWQFERAWVHDRGWNEPYLFRDVFAHFIETHISVNRTKWNNLSKDRKFISPSLGGLGEDEDNYYNLQEYEQQAVESKEACAEACLRKSEEECVQWMFAPGRCYLGKDIRFGKSDEGEEDHWASGWMQQRMEKFRDRLRDCSVRWSG